MLDFEGKHKTEEDIARDLCNIVVKMPWRTGAFAIFGRNDGDVGSFLDPLQNAQF